MNLNAVCEIIAPTSQVSDTKPLQREHGDETWPQQRCRATLGSIAREATALGKTGVGLWDIRLQSAKPIASGYRIRIKLDTETAWRELEVLTAVKVMHWHLSCKGVG